MHLNGTNTGYITGTTTSRADSLNMNNIQITSGTRTGSEVMLYGVYTSPLGMTSTALYMKGTIALDGSMSGIWSDNYQGVSRSGVWYTTSGMPNQF